MRSQLQVRYQGIVIGLLFSVVSLIGINISESGGNMVLGWIFYGINASALILSLFFSPSYHWIVYMLVPILFGAISGFAIEKKSRPCYKICSLLRRFADCVYFWTTYLWVFQYFLGSLIG